MLYISPRHTRVTLITFSSPMKTRAVFNLKRFTSGEEVMREIRNVHHIGGTTAIGSGIKEVLRQADPEQGARPDVANKVMVIFTDGWNNKGPEPEEEAGAAAAAGFKVYSVSIVDTRPDATPVNQPVLESLVRNTGETFTQHNLDKLISTVRERNVNCLVNRVTR